MMVCDPLSLIKVSTSHIYLGLNLSEMTIQKSSRYTFLISKVKLRDPLDTVKIHKPIIVGVRFNLPNSYVSNIVFMYVFSYQC